MISLFFFFFWVIQWFQGGCTMAFIISNKTYTQVNMSYRFDILYFMFWPGYTGHNGP